MTQTTNYSLNKPQGSDLFAPLTDYNPNWDAIDAAMHDNQMASVPRATEAIAATVHNITRNVPDAAMFRFTATGNVSGGDTFTVDGIAVTAIAANGQAITAGAWLTGTEVLACLNGNVCTFYVSAASSDAETLQGHTADYFGTAADVETAQQTATAAGNVANQASVDAAAALAAAQAAGVQMVKVWENTDTSSSFPQQTVALTNVPANTKFFVILFCSNSSNKFLACCAAICMPYGSTYNSATLISFDQYGQTWRQCRMTAADTLNIDKAYKRTSFTDNFGTVDNTKSYPLEIYAVA